MYYTILTFNISMTLTLYISCNTFICVILFGLLESSKIILFKDLAEKIIEAKIAVFLLFFPWLRLQFFISKIKSSLNKVILEYSVILNRIVQINELHGIYVKIEYVICPRVYTSSHYGRYLLNEIIFIQILLVGYFSSLKKPNKN